MQISNTPPVLRPRAAAAYCGIGLSTLWLRVKSDPSFPKPWKPSPRTSVINRAELDAWLNQNRPEGVDVGRQA